MVGRKRGGRLLLLVAGVTFIVGVASVSGAATQARAPRATAVGAPGRHFISSAPGQCGAGLQSLAIAGQNICTHGPDAISAESLAAAAAMGRVPAAYPNPPCAQDSGGYVNTNQRVRIFYGYPSDTSYSATDAAKIANWLRIADYNLSQRGGSQHYRFWCGVNSSGQAYVKITVIKLLPIGADGQFTYDDLVQSLYYQTYYGLGNTNYRNSYQDFAVFVDNIGAAYPYGGQGAVQADSRWDRTVNKNNSTSYWKYALINMEANNPADYPAQTFMHEVGHNLGAVQNDAPHSSKNYHCYDEYDTMCYNDNGSYFLNGGQLTYPSACASPPYATEYFDCQRNDYYNAHPASGTYIYSHWNLANSYWLTPRV